MSSKPRDSGTMSSSSAGAQASDAALAAQATQSTAYAKQAHDALFGPDGNSGTLSKFLDPNSLNVSAPTGAYKLQYNQAVGNIAKQSQQTQGSIARANASRGFGNAPAGFAQDEARQAAEDATSQKGQTFTQLAGQSYQDALNNFWNATNIASGSAATNTGAAISADSAAANNYANLYGAASTPTPSVFGPLLGAGLQAGGTAAAASQGRKSSPNNSSILFGGNDPSICWIAEAIYGAHDPRTNLVRTWLRDVYGKTRIGRIVIALYRAHGKQVAEYVKRFRWLRGIFTPLFNIALKKAVANLDGDENG